MLAIEDMSFRGYGGRVPAALGNARQRWRERRGLLLRLGDADGRVGWGEASPLPGYSADTLDQAAAALDSWLQQPHLRDDGRARTAAQDVAAILSAADGPAVPSARFAIETAGLDLLGRRLERPLWRLLAEDPGAAPIPLTALITELDPQRAVAQAEEAEARGIGHFKVKIGRSGEWRREVETIAALRQTGPGRILRFDANRTLPADLLFERLEILAPFEPELLEEPVASAVLADLAAGPRLDELRALGVPLALDESLQEEGVLESLRPLFDAGICRALVLKPMALGGFRVCLELARRAHQLGAAALVTHLFDGPVALAACCALALALPGDRLACGLDHHPALAAWPEIALPMLDSGSVRALELPGLGIAYEEPT